MKVTVEAFGPKSADRLLAAGATQIMIPCIHELDDAIDKASRVRGPVTVHVPANRVADLRQTHTALARNGVNSVLAISGNPGHGRRRYSVYDLIEYFSEAGFEVAVGAYPEGYLTTTSVRHRARSAQIVADKQAAGAHRVITQASFNVANMRGWLTRLRGQGVTLPIHVSAMPTVPWHVVAKMVSRSAAENRFHPIRQFNMPNIDLLFRVVRSHLQSTVGFIHAMQRTDVLGVDDGLHIFSYGVRVDDLVREISALATKPARVPR